MNFKIFNYNRPACELDKDLMSSMTEHDGEYNYELKNEYFENVWFYSDMDLELIEFQIYFTKHGNLRLPNLYRNPLDIQKFYEKKYQTPFFYALTDEGSKEKFHPYRLERFLNFSDFNEIIKPNLKIKLLKEINEEQLNEEGFYVLNNWNFYTELQVSINSNSLLKDIDRIPNGTKKSYSNNGDAKIAATKILIENIRSCTDRQLKGLDINKERLLPKIRKISSDYNLEIRLEKEILLGYIDDCIELFYENGLIPFKIANRKN